MRIATARLSRTPEALPGRRRRNRSRYRSRRDRRRATRSRRIAIRAFRSSDAQRSSPSTRAARMGHLSVTCIGRAGHHAASRVARPSASSRYSVYFDIRSTPDCVAATRAPPLPPSWRLASPCRRPSPPSTPRGRRRSCCSQISVCLAVPVPARLYGWRARVHLFKSGEAAVGRGAGVEVAFAVAGALAVVVGRVVGRPVRVLGRDAGDRDQQGAEDRKATHRSVSVHGSRQARQAMSGAYGGVERPGARERSAPRGHPCARVATGA